jgi:preprotein translocase subunit SecD
MAEPSRGCLNELLFSLILFLNILGIYPQVSPLGNAPRPMPPAPTVSAPVETGLVELVDLSALDASAAQALVGTRISTSGLPDPALPTYATIVDNAGIERAVTRQSERGSWDVLIAFTPEASAILGDHTAAHIGSPMGIVLNGRLLSAPTVQARIEGQAVISGDFTAEEAATLAAQLNAS